MNGRKDSFYEIQLNNRHLVAGFLAAVVLGVAVFGLGVMVGREHASTVPDSGWVEDGLTAEADEADPGVEGDEGDEMDLGFYDTVEQPAEQPAEQAGEPDPVSGSSGSEDVESDAGGEPAAAETSQTRPDLPPHDPAAAQGWIVQVKSTPDRASADALQEALARDGFPAFVITAEVEGRTYFRVRVGRYRDEADATKVAGLLARRDDVDQTWVTEG